MRPMIVIQDGRDFYDEETGRLLFRASAAKDFDLDGAKAARTEFIEYAERQGWVISFED